MLQQVPIKPTSSGSALNVLLCDFMNDDVECPYCETWQDINHDDGYGYEEDKTFEQECVSCEKTFVFTTSISFMYDAHVADCLNGGEHKYKPTMTVPRKYTRMRCVDCSHERPPTESEMKDILGT